MYKILSGIFFLLLVISGFSQMPGNRQGGGMGRTMPTGRMYGKVVEASNGKPIEFATVELLQNRMDTATKTRKNVVVTGHLSEHNGDFSLENVPVMGQYVLKVSAVGLKPYQQNVSFNITRGANGSPDPTAMAAALDKDLGNIKVELENKELANVTVTATKPGLVLGIDRKVFNVEKNIVTTGGSAVDVMKNIPSLNVDIDGNVTMRNNSPQIFVDGRPTTLELEQIPADAIESVELITNPSAKFDASGGTAGILNIIMKKNRKMGYNGNLRLSLDSRLRVGSGLDLNLRQGKVNFFASINFNQRKSISNSTTTRLTQTNPLTRLTQYDESTRPGQFVFARGGLDYFMDNRNTISFTVNRMMGKFSPNTSADIYIDSLFSTPTKSYTNRYTESDMNMNFLGGSINFKHNFPKVGKEWTADINYNNRSSKSNNDILSSYYTMPSQILKNTYRQMQNGNGSGKDITFQSDFVNPLNHDDKLEMGVRASIRNNENVNDLYYSGAGGTMVYSPDLSTNYNSVEQVYAAYTTYSKKIKTFSYQLGLRAESSNYVGKLPSKNQEFNIDFPLSLFPSVFLNKELKNQQQLQLNYSRKINRPNFFQLMPFTDYSDSLNISQGNPNLKPEFTNSLELSYQKIFANRDNFIASLYFKNTNNLIASIQQLTTIANGKQVLLNTYVNANSAYVTGLELVSKNKINNWWDLSPNLNIFTSKIKIDDPAVEEQKQFLSWFAKVNNSFKLSKSFTYQVSGSYQSKTVLPPGGSNSSSGGGGGGGGMRGGGGGGGMFSQSSSSQGYTRPRYSVDMALRYDFWKEKRASLTLNMNDVFRTQVSDVHTESSYFVQDVFRRRDPQILRLNFSYRFGKADYTLFKRKNSRQEDVDMGM